MNKIKCTSVVDSQGNASKIPLAFEYCKDNKYMIEVSDVNKNVNI